MAITSDTPNPGAPNKVKRIERQNMALELRKQGASYRKIADQLKKMNKVSPKYNEHGAWKDCMDALKVMMEKQEELAKENLRLDLERLDEMFVRLYDNAKKGDTFSANTVLAILDRRGKLLNYAALAPTINENLNIDITKLNNDQLKRIINGENPIIVLATPGPSGA